MRVKTFFKLEDEYGRVVKKDHAGTAGLTVSLDSSDNDKFFVECYGTHDELIVMIRELLEFCNSKRDQFGVISEIAIDQYLKGKGE